jgi:hypothetical protein
MNLFLGKIHYCWQEECTVKGLSNAANIGRLKKEWTLEPTAGLKDFFYCRYFFYLSSLLLDFLCP